MGEIFTTASFSFLLRILPEGSRRKHISPPLFSLPAGPPGIPGNPAVFKFPREFAGIFDFQLVLIFGI